MAKKTMKKTTLIIIVATVILGLLILYSFLTKNPMRSPPTPNNPSPTRIQTRSTTPSYTATGTRIVIVNTSPTHNQKEVPLNMPITIQFDQVPASGAVDFSIDPPIQYTSKNEGKTLVISPQNAWQPGITYTYAIKIFGPNVPYVFSFQTVGPTTAYLPDTSPKGAAEENDAFLLESAPAAYVANKTPFENQYFSITYRFKDISSAQIEFIVVKKTDSEQTVQSELTKWLTSLGLTSDQIQSLHLIYQ